MENLNPGWLDRTLRAVSSDVLRWPTWMRVGFGFETGEESYTVQYRCGCSIDGFSEAFRMTCARHDEPVYKTTVITTFDALPEAVPNN